MAHYEGLGVEIKTLLEKLKSTLENRGYIVERVLTGEASFLIDYKKGGVSGKKETISVKGVPDDFIVSGIREEDEEAWFIVEDVILASAKNPQAFRSHTEPGIAASSRTIAKPLQPKPLPTSCSRCGAPLTVTQEDLTVTCRYCGFTITVSTSEEVKKHSMLENHLFAQQAVEAARKYMDKGVLRVGVSRDAQITNVKLRYVPFWVFSADASTFFKGTTGTGITGELRQAQEAMGNKRASGLEKLGKIILAGTGAYMESQRKDRRPQTVSYSFSDHYIWPTIARQTMISEIDYYDVPAAKKIPFDVGKIPRDAEFLNTELGEEEAKARVKSEVEAKERLIAGGKVDTLEVCNTNIVLGEAELVHTPIWFVHYTLKGENYVIPVEGCEGKVLGGGRPLFKIV